MRGAMAGDMTDRMTGAMPLPARAIARLRSRWP